MIISSKDKHPIFFPLPQNKHASRKELKAEEGRMSQFGVVLASQPSIYPSPGHQSELPITLRTWHGKGYGEKVPGNMEPKKSLLWLSPMTLQMETSFCFLF